MFAITNLFSNTLWKKLKFISIIDFLYCIKIFNHFYWFVVNVFSIKFTSHWLVTKNVFFRFEKLFEFVSSSITGFWWNMFLTPKLLYILDLHSLNIYIYVNNFTCKDIAICHEGFYFIPHFLFPVHIDSKNLHYMKNIEQSIKM